MKFQYLKILTNQDEDWAKVEKAGLDGWELVSVRWDMGSVIYYFKKPLK